MTTPAPKHWTTLTAEVDDTGVGRLVLNQPERLNPLGATALRELADAAAWFDRSGVAVVVVTGAGRAFSAGFDLRELPTAAGASAGDVAAAGRDTPGLGAAMADAVSSMAAVTIASIGGPCIGGGLVLALACDLRIAARSSWFSLPEAELGIPLAWGGLPRLVRAVGPDHALDLVLGCRRLEAAEARELGLVTRLVDDADLGEATDRWATQFTARRPEVVTTTKRQVRDAAEALVPSTGPWAGTELLVDALRSLLGDVSG